MASLVEPMAVQGNDHRGRWQAGHAVRAAVAGGVVLPFVALLGTPIHASVVVAASASLLALLTAIATNRLAGRGTASMAVGLLATLIACFLVGEASYPGSAFVVAALLGAGIGVLVPPALDVRAIAAAVACAEALVALRVIFEATTAAVGLAILAAGSGALWFAGRRGGDDPGPTRRGRSATVSAVVLLYAGFSVFWVGSTAPTVTWFGALRSHGPRTGNEVAITFDDGPNPPYTLEIADILEAHGARGTFFEVGKALVERPDVAKDLIARGHMVGNHSYYHGAFSYLDPRYPELAQTDDVFREDVGVCPSVFRPPHGTHTPFMSHVVTSHGMTLVTWDVSAQDWVETDAARLARNILAKVKPGSIILLHDGIDGNIGADRSVVVDALPAILDGLAAKGLKPVTLDKLLGLPATLSQCS